ncbi:MAG: hypothetical protein JST75_18685 [Bacteroidetes bacterium]|nr:hypothetical protein [Bacteroidota bacterium]
MDKKIEQYMAAQSKERWDILLHIHSIIIEEDKTVEPVVEPMMGKEMIVYKDRGMMKYALASVKNYMSLHVLPIYGSSELNSKYKSLLNTASFQKGCINFESEEQMPSKIVRQLIGDCAKIDLVKIREDYLKGRKSKNRSKKV